MKGQLLHNWKYRYGGESGGLFMDLTGMKFHSKLSSIAN